MNRYELQLKEIIHEAALDAGLPVRKARDALNGLVDSLGNDDDASEVAAKALFHLCLDDDRSFNRSTMGLKAVFRFLSEAIPESDQPVDVKPCMVALAGIMKENCTLAKLRLWVSEWYS